MSTFTRRPVPQQVPAGSRPISPIATGSRQQSPNVRGSAANSRQQSPNVRVSAPGSRPISPNVNRQNPFRNTTGPAGSGASSGAGLSFNQDYTANLAPLVEAHQGGAHVQDLTVFNNFRDSIPALNGPEGLLCFLYALHKVAESNNLNVPALNTLVDSALLQLAKNGKVDVKDVEVNKDLVSNFLSAKKISNTTVLGWINQLAAEALTENHQLGAIRKVGSKFEYKKTQVDMKHLYSQILEVAAPTTRSVSKLTSYYDSTAFTQWFVDHMGEIARLAPASHAGYMYIIGKWASSGITDVPEVVASRMIAVVAQLLKAGAQFPGAYGTEVSQILTGNAITPAGKPAVGGGHTKSLKELVGAPHKDTTLKAEGSRNPLLVAFNVVADAITVAA